MIDDWVDAITDTFDDLGRSTGRGLRAWLRRTRRTLWPLRWVRVSPYDPRRYRLRPLCEHPPLVRWMPGDRRYVACRHTGGCGDAHRVPLPDEGW